MLQRIQVTLLLLASLQSIICLPSPSKLKNQMQIKQETNRIDWRIPLSTVLQDEVKEGVYIQVEINLSQSLEQEYSLNQEDISFCLSDSLGSQCVNSLNVDIYQQNFRSRLLFLSKVIGNNTLDQFVTVIASDRLMEAGAHKLYYEVNWDVWETKPSEENLLCPFDCKERGICKNGFCHCNIEFIGRSCEYEIKAVDKAEWSALMKENDILWLKIDSPSPLLLVEFMQGYIQFVAFSDSLSYTISSQYLLNKPQKVILDKRFILQGDDEINHSGSSFLKEENVDLSKAQPLIMCFFSFAKQTKFTLFTVEKKIRDIAQEQDKDYAMTDPRSELLTFVICGLIFLIILGSIALYFVCRSYLEEKSKANILKLYASSKFGDLKMKLQQEDSCRICLEKYADDTLVRVHHKCQKVFHKQCFDQWAQTGNNKKCPQCRDDYEPIVVEILKKQYQQKNQADLIEMQRQNNDQSSQNQNDESLSSNLISEPLVSQPPQEHLSTEQANNQQNEAYSSPSPQLNGIPSSDQGPQASVSTLPTDKKMKRRRSQKKKKADYNPLEDGSEQDSPEIQAMKRKISDANEQNQREREFSTGFLYEEQSDTQNNSRKDEGIDLI